MSDLVIDDWNEDEYDNDDVCEHGVGFDEDCEDCEDDPIGCLYPGECVMPGTHLESECATPEMMEEMTFEDEANKPPA